MRRRSFRNRSVTTVVMLLLLAASAKTQTPSPTPNLVKLISQSELLDSLLKSLAGVQIQKSPIPQLPATHGISRSILLAEDNYINQKLAQKLLANMGHRVVLASNGREALRTLNRKAFDLILMDVQMPEMMALKPPPKFGPKSSRAAPTFQSSR